MWYQVPAVFLLACTSPDSTPPAPVTIENHDGVIIVTNAGLDIADTTAWRVDTTNTVRIGVVEGAPEYMIGRFAGAVRRSDGTIIIADGIAHELRVFDKEGRFVRKVGRAGQGPGEYGWLTRVIEYVADSIVVMDNEDSRATVLDPSLDFVRRYRPMANTPRDTRRTSQRLVDYFRDGTQLVSDYVGRCVLLDGLCEDSVTFYRTSLDGTVLASFGTHVYSRMEMHRFERGINLAWSEPHPQVFWRVHKDRFLYADSKRFEISVYHMDGTLERVIRVQAEHRKYDHAELFPESTNGPSDEFREIDEAWRDVRRRAAIPDSLPFFSGLLVDRTDHIWVREFRPGAGASAAPWWYVFTPDGELRYALRSPPGIQGAGHSRARDNPVIDRDYIVSSVRDELGVESVVVYPLIRGR